MSAKNLKFSAALAAWPRAGVEGLQRGDPRGARLDTVRDLVQHSGPGAAVEPWPGPLFEGAAGGGDGAVQVLRPAGRDRGVRPVGHRVRDVERRAVGAGGGQTADKVLEHDGQALRRAYYRADRSACHRGRSLLFSYPERTVVLVKRSQSGH